MFTTISMTPMPLRNQPSRWIPAGFVLAGVANIGGVLLFSLGFSNARLGELSPLVLSPFGLLCIMLWGLAYLSVAGGYRHVPWLVAVFALEKFAYVYTWVDWMRQHAEQLPALFGESPLTAVFFVIYGPNDLLFGLFFATVAAARLLRRH